jgi:RNA polymerase sigma-70 factor (ECF subfamily)
METTMIAGATLPAQTYMPDDDTALVEASRGGDVAAFEQLVKRYDAKLLRIAQKVTQNPEDAEEAVQEAFFKAYQKLQQFQGHAKFSTWLVRIALNESFMKLRKWRGILEQSIDSNVFPDSDGARLPLDVADPLERADENLAKLGCAVLRLGVRCRLKPALKIVFILRDMEEHSLRETSDILNLTETAVKTRLSRARLQLREELSKYFKKT